MANSNQEMLANAIVDAEQRLQVLATASHDPFIVSGLESEMEAERLVLMRQKRVWSERLAALEVGKTAGNAR